jgi:predicted nucleic acid-binding protein
VVALLDVNVLVALLVPEHEHHTRAVDWFATDGVEYGWATCAVTELGVIRVCAQLLGGTWPPDTVVLQMRGNGG